MRQIPFGCPILGDDERAAVDAVLRGPILTHGPLVKEFEAAFAAFTGAPHAVAVSSCTAALHLAYLYLGVGDGDEVLVPAQSHTATAHAVEYCGARPVFVDSEERTGNMDLEQLEGLVTERTKAISVVHYLGMPVDMERVMAIAERHGLFVVEDCALAIGTYFNGIHAGLHGDVGCFSFYPVKHMTTGEGGMVITRHEDVAHRIGMLRAFGIDRNVPAERKVPGMYDVQLLGFNYRLNELGAALGLAQLRRVTGFIQQRKENYLLLTKGLQGIGGIQLLQASHGRFQSSYYCHSMILKEPLQEYRVQIMNLLKEKGIGTSIYYPEPIPHMSYYRNKYGYGPETYPVAARISRNSIALPVGPHLDADDITYMLDSIRAILTEVEKNE